MAQLVLVNLDLNGNQILNVVAQVLASDPGSPVEGQFWYNSTSKTLKFRTNTATIIVGRLDQTSAPTASVDLNSQKIINLLAPTAAGDAATKGYVDGVSQGLSWKSAVRVATTAAGTFATSFANGQTVDGIALVTGDRILIKNQAAPAANGLYTVNVSGAPTRATDADTAAEILQSAVFVEEGTVNADTAWVMSTNAPITLETTSLSFVQFGAGATYTPGTGIDITGTVVSLLNPVTIGLGGTGGASAAAAKTNLGFMTRFAASVGDGAATSYNVDHNLGTLDVEVMTYRVSDGVRVITDATVSTVNRVIVAFAVAPTANQYRVVVIG